MKTKFVFAIAGFVCLTSALCSACIESVTTQNVTCGGYGCSQTVSITVPSAQGPYGTFAIWGWISCCGTNFSTINYLYGQCVGVQSNTPKTQERFVQVADLLVPDCHGKFIYYEGSKGALKPNLTWMNGRAVR